MAGRKYFVFSVLVILNLLFLFAVIMDVVFPVSRLLQSVLLITADICYLLRGKSKTKRVSYRAKSNPFTVCYVIYLILLLVQTFVALISGNTSTAFLALSIFAISFLFWRILLSAYSETLSYIDVINPYVIICKYVLIASIIVFILLLSGTISLTRFSIDPTKYELFNGNYEIGGYSIYHPMRLVFVGGSDRGINFFGQFGPFLGICHEPHLSTFLFAPAVFMLLAYCRNKIFWVVMFVLNVLMAGSVTNLVLTAASLLVYFVIENRFLPRGVRFFCFFSMVIILVVCVLHYEDISSIIGLEIIGNKFQAGNASFDTSYDIIKYMYSPKSILGSGVLTYCYNPKATDIGFLTFFLIIIFQLSFIFGVVRTLAKGTRPSRIIAVGLLYFALHSLKIGQMIFQFPYLVFILFAGNIIYPSHNLYYHEKNSVLST